MEYLCSIIARQVDASGDVVIEYAKINKTPIFLVDAISHEGDSEPIKLGLMCSSLKECASRGQFTKIAQAYKIVEPGMIMAKHVFQGLNRPLNTDGSQNGDASKLIYTWKPVWDYEWSGGREGGPVRKKAISKKIFFVIVTKNIKHLADYPDIEGWIEHWSWWDEDSAFPNAPIEWVDRFNKKLFTAPSTQVRFRTI